MHRATVAELKTKLTVSIEALRVSEERATASRLALEVMHEIRNLVEALGHLTYLACQEACDAGKVRKYMDLAEEQIATLHRIAGQTLGFARADLSQKQYQPLSF